MGKVKNRRKIAQSKTGTSKDAVRRLTCGRVMKTAQTVDEFASVLDVLEVLTKHNWDHVFIVSSTLSFLEGVHQVTIYGKQYFL